MITYQPKSLLRHFGILERGAYRGELHEQYLERIMDGIDSNAMMALVGSYGQGKTVLAEFMAQEIAALKAKSMLSDVKIVYIRNQNLEKLSLGGVLDAIIWDLSVETPRLHGEAKARQANRILGTRYVDSKRTKHTLILIDNAHRLSVSSLMQLKDFWERDWSLVPALFSLLLVGQPELLDKLSVRKEVLWRFQIMDLSRDGRWMSFDEKINYLKTVYGPAITDGARDRMAAKASGPLQMENLVREAMENAQMAGLKQVTEEVIPMTQLERMQHLGVSYRQLAKEAGIAPSSVEDVVKGRSEDEENKRRVEEAMQKLEAERRRKAV